MTVTQLEIQLVAVVVAVACALPGVFLVLRRMAMMSDAISHTVLLGIVIGFFLTRSLDSPLLVLGAAAMGVLTVSLVEGGIAERLLKNVQVPVLVSVGDRDELVLLPEAFRLSRALPNGELLVLPNTRHPLQTVRLVPLLPMMQIFHTE